MLTAQRCEQPGIADRFWIEQLTFDVRRARERVGESIAETQVVFPYF